MCQVDIDSTEKKQVESIQQSLPQKGQEQEQTTTKKRKKNQISYVREPLSVLCHHQPILESTQVGEAEDYEDRITLPIDFIEGFLFRDDLCNQISSRRLGSRYTQLELEGVFFRPG